MGAWLCGRERKGGSSSPKISEIQIQQAIGRGLRNDGLGFKGKNLNKILYILLLSNNLKSYQIIRFFTKRPTIEH